MFRIGDVLDDHAAVVDLAGEARVHVEDQLTSGAVPVRQGVRTRRVVVVNEVVEGPRVLFCGIRFSQFLVNGGKYLEGEESLK